VNVVDWSPEHAPSPRAINLLTMAAAADSQPAFQQAPSGQPVGYRTMGKPAEAGVGGDTRGQLRRSLAYVYTMVMLCIFAAPTILCIQLGFDPDVRFWIGRWGLLAFLVPPFFFLSFLFHVRMILLGRLSKRFFIWVVCLPAVFFCLLGGYYMSQGSYLYGQLKSDDCSGGGFLPQKRELQGAYDAALKIYSGCITRLYDQNGGVTLPFRPTLQSCEEWQQLHAKPAWNLSIAMNDPRHYNVRGAHNKHEPWTPYAVSTSTASPDEWSPQQVAQDAEASLEGASGEVAGHQPGRRDLAHISHPADKAINDHIVRPEWTYLASVEANHVCGGFCKSGPMLWTSYDQTGRYGGKCSPFVAQKFLTVNHHGVVILWVELATILICFTFYMLARPLLMDLGYD